MSTPSTPDARYLEALEEIAPVAAKALRSRGDLSRAGSAEALAVAAALLPAALARHRKRRGGDLAAVLEVLSKHGSRRALEQPRAHVALPPGAPEPSPRLGGLLGDDGPRAATWIATRTSDPAGILGRALAASAPLVLAAVALLPASDLGPWLDLHADDVLADPQRLLLPEGLAGETFRSVRGRAFPWWTRVLP